MISMILAMDKNRLIGTSEENKLPWHYPEDLKFFRKMTENEHVLMGHTTYLSMKEYSKGKPLKFPKVYVANLEDYNYDDENVVHIKKIEEIIKNYKKNRRNNLFVLGGATIYKIMFEHTDEFFITEIDQEHEGDVFLPEEVNFNSLVLIDERKLDNTNLTFKFYSRKKQEV